LSSRKIFVHAFEIRKAEPDPAQFFVNGHTSFPVTVRKICGVTGLVEHDNNVRNYSLSHSNTHAFLVKMAVSSKEKAS